MKAHRNTLGGARAPDQEREAPDHKRKGKSPFEDLLAATARPAAPAPADVTKPAAAPAKVERKRAVPREAEPIRPAFGPALPAPVAPRVQEVAAPAPVHVPRAALEDPALLVSIRPGSATVRVQPAPDAAAVTLRVGVQQGVATIRAEGASSAQLLAGHQPELEAALARQGLTLGALELPPVDPPKKPAPPSRRRTGRPFHQQA